ncbi:MAG: class I SAM-dependent methyltransferase [Anaerolineaceae bacterium]
MAKLEIIHPEDEKKPGFTETIEVRGWGICGSDQQLFYIGSGFNFQASGNLWLEISYRVEGAQLFYTRNFLQDIDDESAEALEKRLDEQAEKGEGVFGFGDMMPETSILLTFEPFTFDDENHEKKRVVDCTLKISADTGAVFGRAEPGVRFMNSELKYISAADGVRFMRELIHEITAAQQGKHPDPASYPADSSEWAFLWQLNREAYNRISEHYQEDYFKYPPLVEAFDSWLTQLPAGGSVLDAGCGHGDPVITRLLEKGFHVTGSDFSPNMLKHASQRFPQVEFLPRATTQIDQQAAFDGICSFNSVLYLDLIDLSNSIYRLHTALKPNGLLFLYGFDNGPERRGEPFSHTVGEWMWSWHYGMEEAANILEEHGYFNVLDARKVMVDEGEAERIARELEKQEKERENNLQMEKNHPLPVELPYPNFPVQRSPYADVIIARKRDK